MKEGGKRRRTLTPMAPGLTSLAVALALSLSACGVLDEGGTPRNARITIQGGSGEAVELVTNNDFAIVSGDDGQTRDVFLYSADTVEIVPEFEQRYSLGSWVRFFVSAFTEAALAQPVTMHVFIDGERRFSGTSALGDEELEFLYSFR